MAGNMKAVKLRIKSIQSTMQITKAMELVASSKLRKAKERAEESRPYFEALRQTLAGIAAENTEFMSVYTKANGKNSRCYVVIAGDRGLAGGYNANLFRAVQEEIEKNGGAYQILPIGKKALEYAHRTGAKVLTESFAEAGALSVSDCFEIARMLCELYKDGGCGHIVLCYTAFRSMLSQEPEISAMLPLADFSGAEAGARTGDSSISGRGAAAEAENAAVSDEAKPVGGSAKKPRALIWYDPDSETVFNAIVPEYLAGLVYGALCESVASELAARRTAMDAATKNAGDMIDDLSLRYNRARQAGITQELTEIVAGAEET